MSISCFGDAFSIVLDSEGRFVDDPADPGSATMFGVTERVARAWGYSGAMQAMTLSTAQAIAKAWYWNPYQCDQFDPRVAFNVFDAAYNGGRPAQWLQAAAGVTQDGRIGAITIAAVRAHNPMQIIAQFNASRLSYYTSLTDEWPTFGRGWINRIARNLQLSATGAA
jgi:lysozyme family protein